MKYAFLYLFLITQSVAATPTTVLTEAPITERNARDATLTNRRYTLDERDEFQKRLKNEIELAKKDISVLRESLKTKSEEARVVLEGRILRLEKRQIVLSGKAERLSMATQETWKEMRKDTQSSFKKLTKNIHDTAAEVRKAK